MKELNWRRGLIRLWVVVSLAWISFLVIIADWRCAFDVSERFIGHQCYGIGPATNTDLLKFLGLALSMPLAMIAIAKIVAWTMGGFSKAP